MNLARHSGPERSEGLDDADDEQSESSGETAD